MRAVPHDRVRMGKRSVMIFDDAGVLSLSSQRIGRSEARRGDASLRIESRYDRTVEGVQTCTLTTIVEVAGRAPDERRLVLEPSMIVVQPSIGLLHHSLDGVEVGSAVELTLSCEVVPPGLICSPTEQQVGSPLFGAAEQRVAAMRLDAAHVDFDDPVRQVVDLSVAISPADRQPIDFLTAPRRPVAQLLWARRPSADDMRDLRDLYAGVSGTAAIVCEVQVDASLVCAPEGWPEPDVGGAQLRLAAAAVDIVRRYEPAPALATGEPSAGIVFELPVRFGPTARSSSER